MSGTLLRIFRVFTLAVILLPGYSAIVCAQSESSSNANSHRWAILIGVDDYAQLNDLEFCGADQQALRDQLMAAGFPEKQIFLLHDKTIEKKYQPFKVNIEKQLSLVLKLVEPGDTVIVAFSGHGIQLGKTPYLCPTEARLDDPQSLVSIDWVYEQLRDCPATLRLLLVDACRNDPRLGSPRSATPSEATKELARSLEKTPPEGILLLTSCSAGEMSMEEKEFGHGVFMHYFVEGLQGAADADQNGRVSLGELSNYAGSETKLYVARKFNDSQRPKLRGDLTIEALGFEMNQVASKMAGKRAGEERADNGLKMKFCWCPPGTFSMGSPKDEEGRDEDEDQVKVSLTKGFWMGKFEVTQDEWRQLMGTTMEQQAKIIHGPQYEYGGYRGRRDDEGPRFPMDYVRYDDAIDFCRKLTEQEQRAGGLPTSWEYSLPTEAQWEYACRAGTTTVFAFGNSLSSRQANFDGSRPYGGANKGPRLEHYTEVGTYRPNTWGLCDMHGNAPEWCADFYYFQLPGGDDPIVNKLPGSHPRFCVTRSSPSLFGGVGYAGDSYRSANRGWRAPSLSCGLRVALCPSIGSDTSVIPDEGATLRGVIADEQSEPVTAVVHLNTNRLPAGRTCRVLVTLTVRDDCYVWGYSDPKNDEYKPVRITMDSKHGSRLLGVRFPKAHPLAIDTSTSYLVLGRQVNCFATIEVPELAGNKSEELEWEIRYRADTCEVCFPEKTLKLKLKIPVAPAGEKVKTINQELFDRVNPTETQ